MRGFVLLALIGRVASAQGVEASRVIAASATEVHLDLAQKAFVTVLRVLSDSTAELVYPFDPLQSRYAAAVTHQLRFGAGTRQVKLPVPIDVFVATVRPPDQQADAMGPDNACVMRRVAHLLSIGRPVSVDVAFRKPEAVPGPFACGSRHPAPVTTPEWRSRPAPEQLGAHRVVVIVSEQRVDLKALSRAAASLSVAYPSEALLHVLAAQEGAWAVYVASVD